jgi:hypothetical protein
MRDEFETTDGSRPEATTLAEGIARRLRLGAFSLLQHGDAFEDLAGSPPRDGLARARDYITSRIEVRPHGASADQVERVRAKLASQLSGNPTLVDRLREARPITIDLIPPGRAMAKYGFPAAVNEQVSGLFWDHPSWPRARIAFRQERLETSRALIVHEMAHALHYLAFTESEREAIYRVLLPTYRSRAAADEVFAIYSEREFLPDFTGDDRRAPGVYGLARSRWNEQHVFTRFVRNLYFPHKRLAGA